jgi:hypothetical protein
MNAARMGGIFVPNGRGTPLVEIGFASACGSSGQGQKHDAEVRPLRSEPELLLGSALVYGLMVAGALAGAIIGARQSKYFQIGKHGRP